MGFAAPGDEPSEILPLHWRAVRPDAAVRNASGRGRSQQTQSAKSRARPSLSSEAAKRKSVEVSRILTAKPPKRRCADRFTLVPAARSAPIEQTLPRRKNRLRQ
jgi:hypothetical protein